MLLLLSIFSRLPGLLLGSLPRSVPRSLRTVRSLPGLVLHCLQAGDCLLLCSPSRFPSPKADVSISVAATIRGNCLHLRRKHWRAHGGDWRTGKRRAGSGHERNEECVKKSEKRKRCEKKRKISENSERSVKTDKDEGKLRERNVKVR